MQTVTHHTRPDRVYVYLIETKWLIVFACGQLRARTRNQLKRTYLCGSERTHATLFHWNLRLLIYSNWVIQLNCCWFSSRLMAYSFDIRLTNMVQCETNWLARIKIDEVIANISVWKFIGAKLASAMRTICSGYVRMIAFLWLTPSIVWIAVGRFFLPFASNVL